MAARVAPLPGKNIAWSDLSPAGTSPIVGGFGVVFSARWVSQRRDVAVKVPIAVVSSFGAAINIQLDGVLSEADKLVRASDHGVNDAVVPFFGVASGPTSAAWARACDRARAALAAKGHASAPPSVTAGAPQLLGLVMEWQGGGSLEAALFPLGAAAAPWPHTLPDRLNVLCTVAEGLWRLHGSGIVHGDIKSENVLLSAAAGAAERQPRLADFGFAELRAAADRVSRASHISLAREATDVVKGTWAYMAPEMRPSRTPAGVVTPLAASRRTDVYAYGTLAWEVLCGEAPWAQFDEVSRLTEIRTGKTLDFAKLPRLLPMSTVDVLKRCMALDRAARPLMGEVLQSLEQARDQLTGGGRKQVFLSYRWGRGGADVSRKPLATEVYNALVAEGFSVWVDQVEMQHDFAKSMYDGVSSCDVIVALLSPDYSASENCLFELRCAVAAKKPIIACCAEPGFWKSWPHTAGLDEMAQLAKLETCCRVDFGEASAVDWLADPMVPEAERRKLTEKPEALPRLLELLREKVAQAAAGGGGGAAASPRRRAAPQPQQQAEASLPSAVDALTKCLQLLTGEDRGGPAAAAAAAQGGVEARLLAQQRALEGHSAALSTSAAELRAKADEALGVAAAREDEAKALNAGGVRKKAEAAAIREAAKAALSAAIAKAADGFDEAARITHGADNVRADYMVFEAIDMQENALRLRAYATELRDAAAKALAALATAADARRTIVAAAGVAGADLIAERAAGKAREAAAARARALADEGVGGAGTVAEVDAAVARLERLVAAQAAFVEAARAVPGARENAALAVENEALRARMAGLAKARAEAGRLDEEAARLRVESSAARERALTEGASTEEAAQLRVESSAARERALTEGASTEEIARLGPARVVLMMSERGEDVKVARLGAFALAAIAARGDGERDACTAAGAIPVLVTALSRRFVGEPPLRWWQFACCYSPNYAGDASVCVSASFALGNFASGNDACRNACAAAGAIPALVGALTRHAGEAGVCNYASRALGNIMTSPAHRAAAVAAGAVPRLAAAWSRHPSAKAAAHGALEKLGYADTGARLR